MSKKTSNRSYKRFLKQQLKQQMKQKHDQKIIDKYKEVITTAMNLTDEQRQYLDDPIVQQSLVHSDASRPDTVKTLIDNIQNPLYQQLIRLLLERTITVDICTDIIVHSAGNTILNEPEPWIKSECYICFKPVNTQQIEFKCGHNNVHLDCLQKQLRMNTKQVSMLYGYQVGKNDIIKLYHQDTLCSCCICRQLNSLPKSQFAVHVQNDFIYVHVWYSIPQQTILSTIRIPVKQYEQRVSSMLSRVPISRHTWDTHMLPTLMYMFLSRFQYSQKCINQTFQQYIMDNVAFDFKTQYLSYKELFKSCTKQCKSALYVNLNYTFLIDSIDIYWYLYGWRSFLIAQQNSCHKIDPLRLITVYQPESNKQLHDIEIVQHRISLQRSSEFKQEYTQQYLNSLFE